MTVIAFSRLIGPVPINCVISEKHVSSLEITSNPIETGAEANDHAYVKPKEVTLEIADRNAALIYNILVQFQETRVPFYLVTGLTIYPDMLIQSIDATRDKTHSRILRATVTLKQVIIVSTASAAREGGAKSSGNAGGKKSRTSAPPSAERAQAGTTADRAASTVQRGDNPTTTVNQQKSQSLLKGIFG